MTNVSHFLATRNVPLPFSLPVSGPGEVRLEAQAAPEGDLSIARRTMGTMRRGMVRMTSSLRIKHAEDFGRKPLQERGYKGNLPDESDDLSDNSADDTRNGEGLPAAQVGSESVETSDLEEINVLS